MKRLNSRIISLLIIFIVLPCMVKAQSAEFWGVVSVSNQITPSWIVDASHQNNFRNGGENYFSYTHVRVGHQFSDQWDAFAGYRHVFHRIAQPGLWSIEYRPTIEARYKWTWGGFDISDRHRFSYRMYPQKKDYIQSRNIFSIITPLELTALKITPYVANESFFNHKSRKFTGNHFYIGLQVAPLDHFKIHFDYIWFKNRVQNKWGTIHVGQIVSIIHF